jgi:hypothetical protein
VSDETASTLAIDSSEKSNEAARRAIRFVSEKGSAAAESAGRAGRRMARSVSQKLRNGASKGGRAALSRLTDAGIKVTEKQHQALERLKGKVSDS